MLPDASRAGVVELYNSALTLQALQESADAVALFDNATLHATAEKRVARARRAAGLGPGGASAGSNPRAGPLSLPSAPPPLVRFAQLRIPLSANEFNALTGAVRRAGPGNAPLFPRGGEVGVGSRREDEAGSYAGATIWDVNAIVAERLAGLVLPGQSVAGGRGSAGFSGAGFGGGSFGGGGGGSVLEAAASALSAVSARSSFSLAGIVADACPMPSMKMLDLHCAFEGQEAALPFSAAAASASAAARM